MGEEEERLVQICDPFFFVVFFVVVDVDCDFNFSSLPKSLARVNQDCS